MQSWLTDLPAIQTGMLVVSAVTFHGTGSEARPRPTTRAAAVKSRLRLHWELFLYSQKKLRRLSNVTFPNRKSGSSATDSGNRNLTLSQFLRVKLCCVVLCSHAPPSSLHIITVFSADEQKVNVSVSARVSPAPDSQVVSFKLH